MTEARSITATDEQIAENLATVRADTVAAGREDVRIIAVTKGFDRSAIDAARRIGIVDVGENYAQEVIEKADALGDDLTMHFIGRIQRNKVRKISEHVALWHSVARPEIITELAKRSESPRMLIQVRPHGDETKDGVDPSDIDMMLETAGDVGVAVDGLMTIGVLGDAEATRRCFDEVARLADEFGLPERSMGMSGDYRDALEAGATILRLGSLLFGPRPAR